MCTCDFFSWGLDQTRCPLTAAYDIPSFLHSADKARSEDESAAHHIPDPAPNRKKKLVKSAKWSRELRFNHRDERERCNMHGI